MLRRWFSEKRVSPPDRPRGNPQEPGSISSGSLPPIQSDEPPERPTLGSGTALVGAAEITMAGLGAVVSIIVARILGPADMGAFTVIGGAFLFASTISSLGLPTGFQYYVSRRMQNAADAVSQAQITALPLGVLGGAAVLGLAAATSDGIFRDIPLETLTAAMVLLPFSLLLVALLSIALARDRHRAYAVANVGNMVLYLVLAAAFTPLFGLTGAVLAATVPYAVASLGLRAWLRHSLEERSPDWLRHAWGQIRRATAFGIKSYASRLLGVFNRRADLFILNAVAIQATVGHYAIAVGVTSVGLLMPKALSQTVLPRVASLDDDAGWEQAMVVRKSVRHALVIGLATMGLLAVGALLIPVIYGSAFAPATALGLILAPGIAAMGVATVLTGTTAGKGRPQYSLYTALLVTPPTVVGYLVLIPALEAVGAAVVSTASYTATLIITVLFFRRATGMRRWRDMLPAREELRDYMALARQLWRAGRLRLRAAASGRTR